MELRQIRYFVAVAEELNFRAAAERLYIAQPSLSQQISMLERSLGVRLLERTTRKVSLTAAGSVFLERARRILVDVDAAAADALRAASGHLGSLSVGFTRSASYEMLPAVARAFRVACPNVDLNLRGEMLTTEQTALLLDGSLDIGFLRPPVSRAELEVEVLRTERLYAIVPTDHRLASRAVVQHHHLANEPFILYGSAVSTAFEVPASEAFEQRVAYEVNETSTLVNFVAAGLGVAIVPESVRHLQVDGVTFIPLTGANATVDLAMSWRRENRSPTLHRFLDIVRSNIGSPSHFDAIPPQEVVSAGR